LIFIAMLLASTPGLAGEEKRDNGSKIETKVKINERI